MCIMVKNEHNPNHFIDKMRRYLFFLICLLKNNGNLRIQDEFLKGNFDFCGI